MSDFQQQDDGRDAQQEAYAQELMDERYRMTCEAIDRCAKSGGNIEDLKWLCRETGVDIKHTILGDEIKVRRAA